MSRITIVEVCKSAIRTKVTIAQDMQVQEGGVMALWPNVWVQCCAIRISGYDDSDDSIGAETRDKDV